MEHNVFVDYGDRHVVLNSCQSDCRKIFPTANRIAETEAPRANRTAGKNFRRPIGLQKLKRREPIA